MIAPHPANNNDESKTTEDLLREAISLAEFNVKSLTTDVSGNPRKWLQEAIKLLTKNEAAAVVAMVAKHRLAWLNQSRVLADDLQGQRNWLLGGLPEMRKVRDALTQLKQKFFGTSSV